MILRVVLRIQRWWRDFQTKKKIVAIFKSFERKRIEIAKKYAKMLMKRVKLRRKLKSLVANCNLSNIREVKFGNSVARYAKRWRWKTHIYRKHKRLSVSFAFLLLFFKRSAELYKEKRLH